jgi:hypothetical protein
MTDPRLRLLRATLAVNAISSGLTGLVLALAAVPLAPLVGLAGPLPLVVFGVALVVFALRVWAARREPMSLTRAGVILALDVAYVIASVVFLLDGPGVLSPLGRLLVAIMADIVAVFAAFEYAGLRRARSPVEA